MTDKKKISVLVSYPDHFEVVEIPRELDSFQKIVGGYIEAVPRPSYESGWAAYCNEEGKFEGLPINHAANEFMDHLYRSEGRGSFTQFDCLVGNIIWFTDSVADNGDEASLPIDYIRRFADVYIETEWQRHFVGEPLITIVRDGLDLWVYDQLAPSAYPQIVVDRVKAARSRAEHGTIEVWSGITGPKWVELRVEIMDDVTGIRLHDERTDKSFG